MHYERSMETLTETTCCRINTHRLINIQRMKMQYQTVTAQTTLLGHTHTQLRDKKIVPTVFKYLFSSQPAPKFFLLSVLLFLKSTRFTYVGWISTPNIIKKRAQQSKEKHFFWWLCSKQHDVWVSTITGELWAVVPHRSLYKKSPERKREWKAQFSVSVCVPELNHTKQGGCTQEIFPPLNSDTKERPWQGNR